MGELQLRPDEYCKLTWRQYVMMAKGFFKRRSYDFEHTRAICYHIAAVNRDPKKPFPTISKYWPLPTDNEGLPDEQTEYKRLKRILAQYKQGKLNQK